jgi:hypothetical protein
VKAKERAKRSTRTPLQTPQFPRKIRAKQERRPLHLENTSRISEDGKSKKSQNFPAKVQDRTSDDGNFQAPPSENILENAATEHHKDGTHWEYPGFSLL